MLAAKVFGVHALLPWESRLLSFSDSSEVTTMIGLGFNSTWRKRDSPLLTFKRIPQRALQSIHVWVTNRRSNCPSVETRRPSLLLGADTIEVVVCLAVRLVSTFRDTMGMVRQAYLTQMAVFAPVFPHF